MTDDKPQHRDEPTATAARSKRSRRAPASQKSKGANAAFQLRAPGPGRVDLGRFLDMREALAFKQRLAESAAARPLPVLDASAVEKVSAGGLQVLASFILTVAGAGEKAILWRPSAALLTGLEDLGLSPILTQCTLES